MNKKGKKRQERITGNRKNKNKEKVARIVRIKIRFGRKKICV